MLDKDSLTVEDIPALKKQINSWKNRAAMAKQAGNAELERQALERKSHYENRLARLQEFV